MLVWHAAITFLFDVQALYKLPYSEADPTWERLLLFASHSTSGKKKDKVPQSRTYIPTSLAAREYKNNDECPTFFEIS